MNGSHRKGSSLAIWRSAALCRSRMKWLVAAATAIAVLLLFLLISGIADISCQAGSWDPGRYTCKTYRSGVITVRCVRPPHLCML